MKFQGIIREMLEEQLDPVRLGKAIYDKITGVIAPKKKPTGPLPFSPKNLFAELKKQGVSFPDVALAQARLESAHFKSDIFKDNNNLFGMKHPSVRQTVSKGVNRGHANYTTWQDSVKDYKLWQDFYKVSSMSKDQFIKKLNNIYCIPPVCKAGDYSRKVKSLMNFGSLNENTEEANQRVKEVAKSVLTYFIFEDDPSDWVVDTDISLHYGSFSIGDPDDDYGILEYKIETEYTSRSKFYSGSYDEPPSSDPAEYEIFVTGLVVYEYGTVIYDGPDFTNFENLKIGTSKQGRDYTGLDFIYDNFGGTFEDLEYNDDNDNYDY